MQVETFHENYPPKEKIASAINDFPTELDETINNIIEKEQYLTYKVHKRTISTNGGNYLGVLYEVDVKGKTKYGDKETNLFVKIINGAANMSMISIPNVYRVELFAYNELSVIFAELQEDANIPLKERFKMVKSYDHSSTEAIILENITKKGYSTYHRMDVVPLEFTEMSIKELAKLHGLSFALQEKRPDYFNRKIKEIKFPVTFGDDWHGFIKSIHDMTMKNVDDDIKDKVESSFYRVTDRYAQYLQDESLNACLVHGDYKPNNVMAKVVNAKVVDVMPVDYQIMNYGCPVFDFLYFIYSCTDRNMRKSHLSHLKDLYHETLKTFLEYFNIDVDLVYSRKKFEKVYKEKLDYCLSVTFVYLPFILASEEDVPDLTKELAGISFEVDNVYKKRLRGVIDEFIEWGYI